jgi:hypothetical protein
MEWTLTARRTVRSRRRRSSRSRHRSSSPLRRLMVRCCLFFLPSLSPLNRIPPAAAKSLFSPAPSSHVYALTPTPFTTAQLSLLHTASLSLVDSAAREKWKASPSGADAGYGAILHPDGERKRKGGVAAVPRAAAPAPKAGPSAVKKEDEEAKPLAKGKEKAAPATKKKEVKKKDTGPKIGERRGLFSKSFDEPPPKSMSKKGKGKASSDEDSDEDESEEEEVKPKKTVPAKRKSSPTVSRSSSTTTKSVVKPAPKPAPAPAKKKSNVMTIDDDDDDDLWGAMDEEAMMEAEREAQKQVDAKKKAAGSGGVKKSAGAKKGETEREREARELEVRCFLLSRFLPFPFLSLCPPPCAVLHLSSLPYLSSPSFNALLTLSLAGNDGRRSNAARREEAIEARSFVSFPYSCHLPH